MTATSSNRRDFLIGGALGATALFCTAVAPRRNPIALRNVRLLDELVPERIGSWSLSRYDPILIPRGEKGEGTIYDSVLSRYYMSNSAAPVMLLIAYGAEQAGNTQLHRPDVCYPSAGFEMHSWPSVLLRAPGGDITAQSATASTTGRVDQILYWTRIGEEFPANSLDQRWSTLRQTLSGTIPDGVLVRISVVDQDREQALKVIETFANALLTSGGRQLRILLQGRA
jgi:EpsI family protein